MVQILVVLAELWHRRYQVLLPIILLPALAITWSFNQVQTYEATTTLYLDKEQAHSPLLQNIASKEHKSILINTIKRARVIEDTLLETGILMNDLPKYEKDIFISNVRDNINVEIPNDHLIKLNYVSTNESNIEQVLENLSFNFIYEVLTPERYRTEQQLANLSEQIKYYSELEKLSVNALNDLEIQSINNAQNNPKDRRQENLKQIVTLEFDIQRTTAQKQLAEKEYTTLLARAKNLMNIQAGEGSNTVLSFVEPPVKLASPSRIQQHVLYALRGLGIAIILSIILILISHTTDKSLRREEDIVDEFGVKILGRIPNLGHVTVEDGRLTAELKTNL